MSETVAPVFGVIVKLSNGNVHQVLLNQEQYDHVTEAIRQCAGSPLKVHADQLQLSIEWIGKAVGDE